MEPMNRAPSRHCLRICAVVGLTLLVPGMAAHASQRAPDTAAITRFVDGQMRVSRIPAIALVIVRGELVVYARTFGGDGAPLTSDSPFLIGSVTKTFTALAIAQLAD